MNVSFFFSETNCLRRFVLQPFVWSTLFDLLLQITRAMVMNSVDSSLFSFVGGGAGTGNGTGTGTGAGAGVCKVS
jgi:hypothetical protein